MVVVSSCQDSVFTLDTPIVGISNKSWRTELADSLMIFYNAWSVVGADLAFTWVLALEVDTSLTPGTSSVLETDGDTWVASCGADTHCLVVQHLALLASITQSGSVTGVDAPARLTSLVGGTLFISSALQLPVRTGEDSLLVDHETVLALANWFVVADLAHLVAVT